MSVIANRRIGIVVDLDALEALIREYVAEHDSDDDLYSRLLLSTFILWLRKRQETTNGTKPAN